MGVHKTDMTHHEYEGFIYLLFIYFILFCNILITICVHTIVKVWLVFLIYHDLTIVTFLFALI